MRLIKNDDHGMLFIVITLLWTWGILSVQAIAGRAFNHPTTRIAYILAGASPSVLALAFVFLAKDQAYRHAFFHRIAGFDLISARSYAFIFLFVPAVAALSLLAEAVITGAAPNLSVLNAYLQRPFSLLVFAGMTLVFGPLAEELGWRGYLFDRLADKGPLAYGILIGFIWSIWHLPMFLISGTYQNTLLGGGILPVLCFFVSTVALSVIMGELVKRNHSSILAAILFHFMINFTGELVPLGETGELVQAGAYILLGGLLLIRGQAIMGLTI